LLHPRGKIAAKNKADMDMYFVEGMKVEEAVMVNG